jgi:hypothetical protein
MVVLKIPITKIAISKVPKDMYSHGEKLLVVSRT